eukprot:SAG31_NODE_3158_length_4610_cov_2.329417_6_plen_61_part_00
MQARTSPEVIVPGARSPDTCAPAYATKLLSNGCVARGSIYQNARLYEIATNPVQVRMKSS